MPTTTNDGSVKSSQQLNTAGSDYNTSEFIISQYLKKYVHTGLPAQVVAVYPIAPGDVTELPVGRVDLKLGIEQMDNFGKLVPTHTIYNVPYMRYQGGRVAFIADPQVGDWGYINFAERDVSRWKRTIKAAMPDSFRTYDQADGFFFDGFLNGTPEIYIQLHPTKGIIIESAETNLSVHIGGNAEIKVDGAYSVESSGNMSFKAPRIDLNEE